MARLEGTIEGFDRQRGWGEIVLRDGRRMRFDIGHCVNLVPLPRMTVRVLVDESASPPKLRWLRHLPTAADPRTIVDVEDFAEVVEHSMPMALADPNNGRTQQRLETLAQVGRSFSSDAALEIVRRIEALLPSARAVLAGDPVGDAILEDLAAMAPDKRALFEALLDHASHATSAKPSTKWLKEAKQRLQDIGEDAFFKRATKWFKELDKRHLANRHMAPEDGLYDPLVSDRNGDIVRGLAWASSLLADVPAAARLVGDLAAQAFKKIPGIGPVSSKVGNACLWSLGAMPGVPGAAQLGRLKAKVRYTTALRLIEKALASAAERAGMSPEDLEEVAVPTCGLDDQGRFEEQLGDWTVIGELEARGSLRLTFKDSSGAITSKVPDALKASHAEDLKEIRGRVKEVETLYPAQVARVSALLGRGRSWSYDDVFERYLVHGLVGPTAQKLVWLIDDVPALWSNGDMVRADGRVLAPSRNAIVTLWHPFSRPSEEVEAWRRLIVERGITQPVKQVFREVILVDARAATARFQGNIVRQNQLGAMLRERGWQVAPLGPFDNAAGMTRTFPDVGASLSLDLNPPFSDMGPDMAGSGVYTHAETGSVRLSPTAEFPPLLLSEALRDLDGAIAASSIVTDSSWASGGDPVGRRYFAEHAFSGRLSASGEARRAALDLLVPKLELAASIEGACLVVRGKSRVCEIHFDSGQMRALNTRELIPASNLRASKNQRQFPVPFAGDSILSGILQRAIAVMSA